LRRGEEENLEIAECGFWNADLEEKHNPKSKIRNRAEGELGEANPKLNTGE